MRDENRSVTPLCDFQEPSFNFYVEDADKAASFYCNLFGFKETFRTPKNGSADHIEVRKGSFIMGFATFKAAKKMHSFEVLEGPARGELVLWTDNVDVAFDYLGGNGVKVLSPPHDFLGTLRSAWFQDPDGNNIQIVSKINQK